MFGDLGSADGLGLQGDGWVTLRDDTVKMAVDKGSSLQLIELVIVAVCVLLLVLFVGIHWLAVWIAFALFTLYRGRGRSATVSLDKIRIIRRNGRRVTFAFAVGEDDWDNRPAVINARNEEDAEAIEAALASHQSDC